MYFNVRVYGLLINEQNQILLVDEEEQGYRFTKFPGGGLEFGEGLTDALKREFMEECNTEINVVEHFYTTDFFVKSAFNNSQLISVYYRVGLASALNVEVKTKLFDFTDAGHELLAFRWKSLDELRPEDVTFPIDQHVIELLKKQV
jgi:8-oxo-dGTP diphosphatase